MNGGINKTDKHPFIFEREGSQGFLEKYYSNPLLKATTCTGATRGDWRFFQKPEALTLMCAGGKLSCLSVLFISVAPKYSLLGEVGCWHEVE
jgi:hypothetical protein